MFRASSAKLSLEPLPHRPTPHNASQQKRARLLDRPIGGASILRHAACESRKHDECELAQKHFMARCLDSVLDALEARASYLLERTTDVSRLTSTE